MNKPIHGRDETMPDMSEYEAREQRLLKSYEVFKRLEPQLLAEHSGRYALMADEELVSIHDSRDEARMAGKRGVASGDYIVQEVGAKPIRLSGRFWGVMRD